MWRRSGSLSPGTRPRLPISSLIEWLGQWSGCPISRYPAGWSRRSGRADVREVLRGSYRIVYQVGKDKVSIATVFHPARLLRPEDLPGLTGLSPSEPAQPPDTEDEPAP